MSGKRQPRQSRRNQDAPGLSLLREWALALLLLAALALQLGFGLASDGLTNDELIYIAAGYRHLTAGDFAINTEQPPLAKLAGALPLAILGLREPPRAGDPWQWAYRFVQVENDPAQVIAWARLANVLLTLALAVLLWRWVRTELGVAPGLLALALMAFHPSLLAHGHLFTTDLPGAFMMVLASWAYWRWSRSPGTLRALLVATSLGLGVTTRLSCWLLLPCFVLIEALTLMRLQSAERAPRMRKLAVVFAAGAVLIPALVWASYGFRYAPWPGESVAAPASATPGLLGRVLTLGFRYHLLPEGYLEGAGFVARHNAAGHPTYLLGQVFPAVGPRYYYLVALAVKNTPGFLVAALMGLTAFRRKSAWHGQGLLLHALVPAAAVFLGATAGQVQIGERYILAVYPYLIIVASSALARLAARQAGRIAVSLVLAAHAVPTLLQAPRGYVPYFNFVAGATEGGHRFLADSNLDWGQDLPRLAKWMKTNGVEQVQLAYHGPDNPDRFGIRHEDLPGMHFYAPREPERPFTGTVAISPNLLLGVFSEPGQSIYAPLRSRPPDARAGVYFIYRLP